MMTTDKNTSPLGVLIMMVLAGLIVFFAMRSCDTTQIQTKYKTEVKTEIKRVHHTDTVYIVQNGHTSHLVRPITKDDSLLTTQTFDVSDSIYEACITTVSKDSVLKVDVDYKFDRPVITNIDTIFVTNTVTNTIENTIQEKPKSRIFIGASMAASKSTWQAGPVVTLDLKRKALISLHMQYQPNIGVIYGGGIQIQLNRK